jgi:stage III sporulation protein AG
MKERPIKEELHKILQKAGPVRIVLVVLCGVVLMLLSCYDSGEKAAVSTGSSGDTEESEEYNNTREAELKKLLEKIDGVGEADVMISLKTSSGKVTGDEQEISGIVIVCQGGEDSVIKREITEAVSALFSIESHKIKIMKRKEAKE